MIQTNIAEGLGEEWLDRFDWIEEFRAIVGDSAAVAIDGRMLPYEWLRTVDGYLMKLVIFGLTMSSSWGNGPATIWRGLCRALIGHGHDIVFFERDVPYYAAHRDLTD